MSTERDKAYGSALFAVAKAEGDITAVRDELFQVARLLGNSDELRDRLADATLPAARRQQIVEDLLAGKVGQTTIALVSMVVAAGRGRDLPGIVDALSEVSAADTGRQLATVRTAIDLTDDQKERLAAALQQATGSPVDIHVVIDPSVLGGAVAQVGDTVIDGTIRHRLDQLKQAI